MSARTNGLRISEALGASIADLDVNQGHRTLFVHRKGNKTATIPLSTFYRGRSVALGRGARAGCQASVMRGSGCEHLPVPTRFAPVFR